MIEPTEEYIISYSEVLDTVAREKIYLAKLEGFPLEETKTFMRNTIEKKTPFLLAVNTDTNQVVGWCDAQPKTEKIGYLGLGLLRDYRGQGIGKLNYWFGLYWNREEHLDMSKWILRFEEVMTEPLDYTKALVFLKWVKWKMALFLEISQTM